MSASPERLDREQAAGELYDAEHLCRYHWIAAAANGRRVLDAGCGTAYGSAILAGAGAAGVVGVDRAGDVLDRVRADMPEGVELLSAELLELPFADGEFDLVTCFEVLEHLPDPEAALDELARVLAPSGILAVSSPNRATYPEGNPHHVREYLPEELRDAVARRFASVELYRQHSWQSAAMLSDADLATVDGEPIRGAAVRKAAAIDPGDETFDVAIASEGDLPPMSPLVVIGPGIDQRAMQELFDGLNEAVSALGDVTAERDQLRIKLSTAEQSLAALPELYAARAELAGIRSSLSWRATAPLRALTEAASRALLPQARRRLKAILEKLIARRSG